MKKFTWEQLGLIFEGQYKISAAEAAEILTKEIYSHHWKHGAAGKIGRMWRDPLIVSTFTHVLEEEDILAKKIGRKKCQKELFYNGKKFSQFLLVAGLVYKKDNAGYKTFKNDYAKWKKISSFINTWKRGDIGLAKARAKVAKKKAAFEELLKYSAKIKSQRGK